jgi:cell division septation protein DedD
MASAATDAPGAPAEEVLEPDAWLVQVGSYSRRATAKRVAKNLQSNGFTAMVLAVDLQGKRLYRVRVGPAADRKIAEQTLQRVQLLMPGSRLVGHP